MAGKLKLTGKIAEIAKKMLRDTAETFKEEGISYLLEGGTLLGIVRENRLLPWDNDLDITITYQDLDKLLKSRWKLWLKGYRTRIRFYKEDIGPFKKGEVKIMKIQTRKFFFFKGYTLLDVFVKKKKGGEYFWTVGGKRMVLKSVPSHYYEDFKEIKFNDFDYSVPKHVEDYLTYRYGDWTKTKKDWNYTKDDKAIVKKGN